MNTIRASRNALSMAVSAGIVLVPMLLAASPVAAQLVSSGGATAGASRRTVNPFPADPSPPPALPGARPGQAAAPQRAPTDMPPNEAMFDGVNRGDIAAVRDAISRGADLNAINILGITATDLAVDLGRNDISFLLLSMRGAIAPRGAQTRAANQPAPASTARPAPRAQAAPAPRPAPRESTSSRTVAYGGPDIPAPSAGFLGFGSGSSSR